MLLFQNIANIAIQEPLRPALCSDQHQITYAELSNKINKLADELTQHNVSRLALLLDNGLEWALIDLACLQANIVLIPVPLFFSSEQQQWLLESSGADALIGPAREGWSVTILNDWPTLSLQRCTPVHIAELPLATAKITYTSGTTGQPKGVCLSAEQIMQVSQSLAERVAPSHIKQHLALLPLATLLENITGLYVPLLTGASSRIPALNKVGFTGSSQFSHQTLAQALKQWRPHSLVLVPELLRLLVMLCRHDNRLADSLRFVAVGGGKVATDLILAAKQLGIPVFEGYGLSECGSVVALNSPEHNVAGSVGLPLPHCQIDIAADGEIMVSGASMLGYLGEPQPSETIATGDLGHFDQQGFLYITGRKKNVQITAFGRNFSPEWVEAQAQLFPAITRIVVFGDGLAANVALIQPTSGLEEQLMEQISRLNQQLPDYAQVHHVIKAQLSVENGLLTNNGRAKRKEIWSQYHDRIQQIIKGNNL